MNDVSSLRDTIVPKSNQLNADDLLAGPITVKVLGVKRGDTAEQPISIEIDGGRQPYFPCKSMRRVMIAAWGDDGRQWAGNSMTLYCDPDVKFGGVKVGGIRISHMTGINGRIAVMLTTTRSKRSEYVVRELVQAGAKTQAAPAPNAPTPFNATDHLLAIADTQDMDALAKAFKVAATAAKAAGDKAAYDLIIKAKDERKQILESTHEGE